MFDWLGELLEPQPRWVVAVDGEWIRVTDDAGETRSVAKAELSRVAIETTNRGIEGMHHWWRLFGEDERTDCVYPLGADGEAAVAEYLTALPGFDHGEMMKAMTSRTDASATVWRRVL
ncbi:MAG TPA: hypothetical protein VF605_15955 [Allosphingosinicella sp.]|jgi:hypothetical protein